MKPLPYFLRKGLWTLLSIGLMILLICGVLYVYLESQLPDVDKLDNVQFQVPLRIYSRDKKLIAEYGEKRRIPVKYEEVPQPLIDAILSTEDQRFFEHPGVDVFGLARAGLQLIKSGRKAQGGSTITMQVARNFFLTRKKTFLRKFNEILLAIKIDSELPKEKILELYLNKIYLGNRSYGVAAAAKVYYGKKLQELTLAQMAMIAGLPQAPSSQNPIRNPKAAFKRRNHVLERMYGREKITKAELEEALSAPITAKYHGKHIQVYAPYVAEMIRLSLYKHFSKAAYEKGYKVYTTIDSKLQQYANQSLINATIGYDRRHGFRGPIDTIDLPQDIYHDKSLIKNLKEIPPIHPLTPAIVTQVEDQLVQVFAKDRHFHTLEWPGIKWANPIKANGKQGPAPKTASDILQTGDIIYLVKKDNMWQLAQIPEIEAAIVSLSPKDGSIVALSGGFNFYKSKFNRVTQANRQPGSSIKPFIYAAALNEGYTLATMINDAPIVIDDPSQENLWRPQNDNKTFNGPTRLRMGLVRSRNLVSIRVLKAVGIDKAINFLSLFGFDREKLPNSLSLALGSLHVTPLQLTTAYAVLANGGFKIEPHLIDEIEDSSGHKILQALPQFACLNECEDLPVSQHAPQVVSEDIAFLMTSALKDVINLGTGRRAKSLKRHDIAGKTGTTNDQKDAWFAGYNGDLVTTVWMGFDNPRSIKEYASNTALPMWISFMGQALNKTKEYNPRMPSNLISVRIDPNTGLRTSRNSKSVFETFRKENLPEMPEDENGSETPDKTQQNIEHLF